MRGLLMHAGQDREQRGLAYHGQADNGSFHLCGQSLQGNFHLGENFFDDALAGVGAALRQRGARVDDDAVREDAGRRGA